ncbi:hypothetical protein jhhlp_001817 [Lomentospora prolificans]|uniref:Endosomal spry domain-containing protein n=1 Tax=Lomentospora prolificans TaxID=41688 RepID=A0A2N3NGS1_9PEZI|nr:hypothetical protein jhhlp_001817 [Lomentospora prolificans]
MPPPPVDLLGPLKARAVLVAREPQTGGTDYEPGVGVINPHDINNTVFFVLFGFIGAAFVIAGIWFFFWAKNGGFEFKDGDWEEYKSTVLRRRGPNGTVISGATAPTNLGGGSVYKDIVDDDGTTVITESTGLSGITAGVSDISARERRRALREKKIKQMQEESRQRKREKQEKKKAKRHVDEDGVVVDEQAEKQAEDELRKYRHERPARVGGLNKESEGSQWDGSTNPSDSTVSSSLISNRQATPTNSPQKSGGIRKVYSTADRTAERERERERERIRTEARRLQERGRQALVEREPSSHRRSRRDFSYQRAAESEIAESAVTRSSRRSERTERTERSDRSERTERTMPGSWAASDIDSELGTKSYHHPIPELRSQSSAAPSRHRSSDNRRSRSGYRRARNEDYPDN